MIFVYSIDWDTDDEYVDLPEEMYLPSTECRTTEDIENYLSNTTGFLVKSFLVEW